MQILLLLLLSLPAFADTTCVDSTKYKNAIIVIRAEKIPVFAIGCDAACPFKIKVIEVYKDSSNIPLDSVLIVNEPSSALISKKEMDIFNKISIATFYFNSYQILENEIYCGLLGNSLYTGTSHRQINCGNSKINKKSR